MIVERALGEPMLAQTNKLIERRASSVSAQRVEVRDQELRRRRLILDDLHPQRVRIRPDLSGLILPQDAGLVRMFPNYAASGTESAVLLGG